MVRESSLRQGSGPTWKVFSQLGYLKSEGSTFSECPDLKRPKGNASAFAGLPSHLGSEVTYPTCLAAELPVTGITS